MSHKDVLQQLFPPVEIEGALATAQAVHGSALDRAEAQVIAVLEEIFADTTSTLLERWEALYEIAPPAGSTLQDRQAMLASRHCRRGDIKKPSLVALAAAMGYTIRIEDYTESQAGWICAGDELLEEPWVYFTAGVSMAGDYLAQEDPRLPWIWEVIVTVVPDVAPVPDLETVLNALKPAELQLNFTYL